MTTLPSDTDPEADKVQVEVLRKSSLQQRLSLACSMTHTAVQLARRAIDRAHPGLTRQERDLLFVEVHYGRELAQELQQYLANRDS